VQRGNRGHNDSVCENGKVRYAHGTEDSDLPGAGWLSAPCVRGLCLFLRYLYTFTMIPFFALLAPDYELPSI
jgi:hypothetical protein